MKKREKKSIILWFIFAIILFLAFSWIIFSYYWDFNEIEQKKEELQEKIQSLQNLEQKWLNYIEFKNIYNKQKAQLFENYKYYDFILSKIDENFYDNLFTNNKFSNFEQLLNSKENFLNAKLNSKDFLEKQQKIRKILPLYWSNKNDVDLTDLKFIEQVENLFEKYNTSYKWEIGITNIVPVENDIISRQDNIYYIPLNLELSWYKKDILQFLKDIETNLDELDNSGKVHQLVEVKKVVFQKYIDNTYDIYRNTKVETLIDYIQRTNQSDDIIKIKAQILFYIKWLWRDKIIEIINTILGSKTKQYLFDENWKKIYFENTKIQKYKLYNYNYNNLLSLVQKLQKNKLVQNNIYYKRKINTIYKYLTDKSLKKDLASIKKELIKSKDLNSIYKKALKYKTIFSKLNREIYSIIVSLGLDKDKKDENWKIIQKSILPRWY